MSIEQEPYSFDDVVFHENFGARDRCRSRPSTKRPGRQCFMFRELVLFVLLADELLAWNYGST